MKNLTAIRTYMYFNKASLLKGHTPLALSFSQGIRNCCSKESRAYGCSETTVSGTHISRKPFANIKSPLDVIFYIQNTDIQIPKNQK